MNRMAITKIQAIAIVIVLVIAGIGGYYAYQMSMPKQKEKVIVWTFPLTTMETFTDMLKNLEKEFESKNPDIDLEFQVYPWGGRDARMITAVAGGEAPDICYFNPRHVAKFLSLNALVPVDDYLPDEYKTGAYEWALKMYYYNGSTWAAPFLVGGPTLAIYSVEAFEKAGITPPSGPEDAWTVDQFIEACLKLKEHGYYLGIPGRVGLPAHLLPAFNMYGADVFPHEGIPWAKTIAFNNSAGVKAFKFFYDLWNTYKVAHPSLAGTPPPGLDTELFAVKKEIGILMAAPFGTAALEIHDKNPDFKWGVLGLIWDKESGKGKWPNLPCMECNSAVGAWGAFKQSFNKHPKAAGKVLSFLLSKHFTEEYCKSGGRLTVYKDLKDMYKGTERWEICKMGEYLKWIDYVRPEWGVHPAATDVYEILVSELESCINGEKTPEEAVRDAASECVQAIKRALK
ncbi:extracellular solute-binding protein [Candidatus Bathyarchaeota archaeon]|nr:extracellular solute-binding protein [Candidatus Bathyarchaeota archaeon]